MSDSEDDNVLQSKIIKRRGRPSTSKPDQNNNENLSGNIKKIGRPVTVSVDGKNPNTAAYKKKYNKEHYDKDKARVQSSKSAKKYRDGYYILLELIDVYKIEIPEALKPRVIELYAQTYHKRYIQEQNIVKEKIKKELESKKYLLNL
jgi:hypothetical protein